MDVRSRRVDLVDAIALSQGDLNVLVVPELGGKVCSIQWQDREVLTRNELRPACYGAPYARFDASGFDECLPSIGPCDFPAAPWNGSAVPDHGEVWSIPWSFQVESKQLRLRTHGVRFPYSFEKVISLIDESRISLQYQLLNHAPFPFPFIWSAHPLLAIQPGWRIHLPAGVKVLVDWSRDERLGDPFTEHDWPETPDRDGHLVDLSLIRDRDAGTVEKLYTNRLNEGPGYYNLGLEPCNGFPDRLDLALERGSCPAAPPHGQLTWRFDLHLGRCESIPAEIKRLRAWSVAA